MTDTQVIGLPLNDKHQALGARMGAFGGWEVPLYYSSITNEHMAVRTKAGLFDISHMGEFLISGETAASELDQILPRKIESMNIGKALYMPLLNEKGGVVDDIIVYRITDDKFLIIVNAGNIAKDFEWFKRYLKTAELKDLSDQYGLLALQGPLAAEILTETFGGFYGDLKRFNVKAFGSGFITRTGYTGEDGFEIMVEKTKLGEVWDALMGVGEKKGLLPCGFGARDTLRMEAGYPLYGHELNDELTPFASGIGWTIDVSKESFVASDILKPLKESKSEKVLVGFQMVDRGIARDGFKILKDGFEVGWVASGSSFPPDNRFMGMAFVDSQFSDLGTKIDIIIREKPVKAEIIQLPFYKASK